MHYFCQQPHMEHAEYTVIALGGSLIIKDKIQTEFLAKFRSFILRFIKKGHCFIIIAGGGKITRKYQQAASKIIRIPNEDLDWLGIHATRLNGHLLRTIFWKEAHPVVIEDLAKPMNEKHKIIIAAGTHPGWSTDYVAIMLARRFGAKRVIVAGTYDAVYDKDFEKYPDAKKLPELTWKHYRKLIAKKWSPGYRAPIDPIAAKAAERYGIRVDVLQAKNFVNFANGIEKKPFIGSIIA